MRRVHEFLKSDRGLMPLFDIIFWTFPIAALGFVLESVLLK